MQSELLTGNAAFHSRDFLGFGRKKKHERSNLASRELKLHRGGHRETALPPHSWGLPAACFKTCLDPRQGNIQHPSNQSRSSDKFVPTNSWGELSVVGFFLPLFKKKTLTSRCHFILKYSLTLVTAEYQAK